MGIKVENKQRGRSKEDEERAFRSMFSVFKRKVNESGILSDFKKKQFYESKSEKRRRKEKESLLQRRKEKYLR